VRVIDAGESRASKIPKSHNYPGFFGIGGLELLTRLRAQAENYSAELTRGRANSLRCKTDHFVASCSDFDVEARFVLVATGLVDHCPHLESGPPECPADSIRFCPICDGYEAMDQRVGVVGELRAAAKKALFLRTYTKALSVFDTGSPAQVENDSNDLKEAGVPVVGRPEKITLVAEGGVSVLTQDGILHKLDALYPAMGCVVGSQLATALGAASNDAGNLVVDENQQTTVPGIYAAGDVVSDLHQLSVAFGHAAIAATHIHNRLPTNWR